MAEVGFISKMNHLKAGTSESKVPKITQSFCD